MKRFFIFLAIFFLMATPILAFSPWPATDSVGTEIDSEILARYSGFEPSGAVWLAGRGTFVIVGDSGQVVEIYPSGEVVGFWTIGWPCDLEDVTVIDDSTSMIYLLEESTSSILEFDLSVGELTDLSWTFYGTDETHGLLHVVDGWAGVEGLTWVPDGDHAFGLTPMGGVFVVGWQHDGDMYIYSPEDSGEITFINEFHTVSGHTDIAGLNYDRNTKIFHAIYDGLDLWEQWDFATETLLGSYNLPGYAEEGIAVATSCPGDTASVLLADDGGRVFLYGGLVSECTDVDDDGYDFSVDCDETNSAINPGADEVCDGVDNDCNDGVDEADALDAVTWYRDADADKYGNALVISVACTVPTGYVSNDTDCNDADSSVNSYTIFYLDADGDGLGSDTIGSFCAITAPTDYVTNSDDTNDSIPNAGVEISGDRISNDGDVRIDEYNTLVENGTHPYYSYLKFLDTSIFGKNILSLDSLKTGEILVEYGDNSIYKYSVFTFRGLIKPTVSSIGGTAFLKIIRGRETVFMNGYTGKIIDWKSLIKILPLSS